MSWSRGSRQGTGGSIRLHGKLGFQQAGNLKEVGTKFDGWLDLVFMQLTLDARKAP
ncbi:hypothetical protein RADP37_01274a (plasmid) [Roseomonas mucosa]|uniref:Uncharacterized protein n=1 Tax=Roseomonas mucosa TaxID=207340 RepID=A0A4Y1MSG6_9PROT|nr:hypothetical protein RADP37_01274a [Roseomonas mucosa]